MSDSEKGIWNGGKTFTNLIRESEDYYDTIDSEIEDREDLKIHKKVCYDDGVWSTKQKDDNGRINRTTEKRD
tara:strand:- start:620 stop:835 length:216 start_codon:yes stop_codon:yes gene_type:complete